MSNVLPFRTRPRPDSPAATAAQLKPAEVHQLRDFYSRNIDQEMPSYHLYNYLTALNASLNNLTDTKRDWLTEGIAWDIQRWDEMSPQLQVWGPSPEEPLEQRLMTVNHFEDVSSPDGTAQRTVIAHDKIRQMCLKFHETHSQIQVGLMIQAVTVPLWMEYMRATGLQVRSYSIDQENYVIKVSHQSTPLKRRYDAVFNMRALLLDGPDLM